MNFGAHKVGSRPIRKRYVVAGLLLIVLALFLIPISLYIPNSGSVSLALVSIFTSATSLWTVAYLIPSKERKGVPIVNKYAMPRLLFINSLVMLVAAVIIDFTS